MTQDYYPFGMGMPGRSYTSSAYRFGFNGKEKDDEVKGVGNEMNFGNRILDPRLGKWLSGDPLPKATLSVYQFARDNPITMIDPDGKDEFHFNRSIGQEGKEKSWLTIVQKDGKDEFYQHVHIHRVDMALNTKIDVDRKTEFYPFDGWSASGVSQTAHSLFLGLVSWKTNDLDKETLAKYVDANPEILTYISGRDIGGQRDGNWSKFASWRNGERKEDKNDEAFLCGGIDIVVGQVAFEAALGPSSTIPSFEGKAGCYIHYFDEAGQPAAYVGQSVDLGSRPLKSLSELMDPNQKGTAVKAGGQYSHTEFMEYDAGRWGSLDEMEHDILKGVKTNSSDIKIYNIRDTPNGWQFEKHENVLQGK